MHIKRKIYNYFRYHHFSTIPVKVSHRDFIDALTVLEDLAGFSTEGGCIESSWKLILEAINSQDDEGLKELHKRILSNRSERGMIK